MLRKLLPALLLLLLLAPGVLHAQSSKSDTYEQLKLFGDVFERVRSSYVEEVTDKELVEAAINGMLSSLDPHSSYLDADSFGDMQVQTKGAFGGLGIEVTMENGFVKVVSPIDDTPAFRAGVEAGDLITHLDSEPVLGLNLSDAVDRMRGEVGSDIVLTIRRGDQEPFDITITRDVIRIQSVRSRVEGNIGYIRVTAFNEQTSPGLDKAIADLKKELGDKVIGWVVDLRNNPGGLLNQAIAVTDAFLDKGEIVSTRARDPEETYRFNAEPGDMVNGQPLIVLINGGSASASEIVAGALQDHGRAIIMGTQSFGKGSVQTIIPLPGHGAMRLTTSRYYTPSGQSIQATGIVPDIEVKQARLEEIDAGSRRREADLRGALTNGDEAGAPATEEEGAPAPEAQEAPSEGEEAAPAAASSSDYQLSRALDLLRGLALFKERAAN
ncbi:S41 family peptidase [Limibacillus halophilus]|uniref:Carboxyl-terminal processing protease n=1 Tax=Limibacillus halophilus TaxID=1579333 RepID=A0A839SUQ2_9PROT|nr:S41 family peptidase [Limibacillus halophilus]MBB3066521.1 carboxyl-terminal processing protease [Limibacillus halophilus]